MSASGEKTVIPCGVAIIRHRGKFLIAQRKPQDTLGSYWEFPGGKKRAGESFEACVVREAREELGVEVAVEEKLMDVKKDYDNKTVWLHFYICAYRSGEPRALDCQRFLWEELKGLKNYKFPPANDPVLEALFRKFGSSAG